MSWDDENYYLIGYDSEVAQIRHYRVDKMLELDITRQRREGREYFRQFDIAAYAKKMFGMFDGEEQLVTLQFENRFSGVVIDRFGKETTFFKMDDNHFAVKVHVAVSRQFLSWIIALGDGVEVLSPESTVEQMRKMGEEIVRRYQQ